MADITITTVEQLKSLALQTPLKDGVYKVTNRKKDGSTSSALIKVWDGGKKCTLADIKATDKTFAMEEFYDGLGDVIVKEGGTVVITPLFEAAPATADEGEAKPQMGLLLLAAIGGYLFGKSAGRP